MSYLKKTMWWLKNNGIRSTFFRVKRRLLKQNISWVRGALDEAKWKGRTWNEGDLIEFLCPFHRGDVICGIAVATTMASLRYNIRMHVSKDLYDWISDIEYEPYFKVEPVDIGIPSSLERDTEAYLWVALKRLANRKDVSGKILYSHPDSDARDSSDRTWNNITEHMILQFDEPKETKLIFPEIKDCKIDLKDKLLKRIDHPIEKCVLLHSQGSYRTKSFTKEVSEQVIKICHDAGYYAVQIGGPKDEMVAGIDGEVLDNLSLSEWAFLLKSSHAFIGVDSWFSHFASALDINQAIIYGATCDNIASSKKHYKNQTAKFVVIESNCDKNCYDVKCHLNQSDYCMKMRADAEKLREIL